MYPSLRITAHLHRRFRSGRRARGSAATQRTTPRLEVLDDVALDSYVGTRRDRRPVLVLLLLRLLLMMRMMMMVMMIVLLLMMVVMLLLVRPSLGQQLLEYRQYGHVQQLALGQRVHPRHTAAAKRRQRRTGRVRRRPAAAHRTARLPSTAVVHVRRAVHVRRRRSPQPGAAVPSRRRRRPAAAAASAGPALLRHRTVYGTGRVQRRRTVVF